MKEQKFEGLPIQTDVQPQKVVGQQSEAQDGHFKNLTVDGTITVKHPDGKGSIVMVANKDKTGIWVQNGVDKQNIGIYAQSDGQLAITIWGPGDKQMPRFAIGIYDNQPADLQVVPPGENNPFNGNQIKTISMADLVRLVQKHGHSQQTPVS